MKIKFVSMLGLIFLTANLLSAHTEISRNSTSKINMEKPTQEYKEIHTDELRDLLKTNPHVILVDVRNLDDGTRIQGAKLIPHDSKEELIIAKLPNKNAAIVVYCVSKDCPASKFMAKRLVKMGYKNVYKYPEGIEGWETSGNPVEKIQPSDEGK